MLSALLALGVASQPCRLDLAGLVTLENGYVKIEFDPSRPGIPRLWADFEGSAQYKQVLASGGIAMEREDGNGAVHSSTAGASQDLTVTTVTNTSQLVEVRIDGIVDDVRNPTVKEYWLISLREKQRTFTLRFSGAITTTVTAKAVRHSFYMLGTSIYGLFQRGVVQMKNAPPSGDFFGSKDQLLEVYVLGGGSSVSIVRDPSAASPQSVLLSSNSGIPYWSGFQEVVAGAFASNDVWNLGWKDMPTTQLNAGDVWDTTLEIGPNNFDFPASAVGTDPNLVTDDLRAILTAIYGSPMGCLATYDKNYPGQIAPSIHRPEAAYGNTYNYFDPDNFIGVSAMLYSGDPYVQNQARLVIERTGAFMLPSGQVPHHFENVPTRPTYVALSGATQTGPNLFWTLTAFRYAKTTQDIDWLRNYMPKLRQSAKFLMGLYDSKQQLIKAPGSLMIDVFIRENFTADTNAMMVGFLNEFGDVERALGNSSGAAVFFDMATKISSAINAKLWSKDGDHYITQVNPDGTTRDFVDYDANLIAVATGVAPDDRAAKILTRVDSGNCTHGHGGSPTWVSERVYGPKDCYNGNTGDSECSMARIGYFDAYARRRVGDLATFNDVLLAPIQRELLAKTWLRERYGCDGKPQEWRTAEYFEYPSYVAMLLREIRYGIDMGVDRITVSPFARTPIKFNYHVGNVNVDFNQASGDVRLNFPGQGQRNIIVERLVANAKFSLATSKGCSVSASSVVSSAQGAVSFSAQIGPDCTITLKQV